MTAFERHDAEAADHHADAVWALYDAVWGDTADQASWRTAVGLLGEGVQVTGLPADGAEQGVPPRDPSPR